MLANNRHCCLKPNSPQNSHLHSHTHTYTCRISIWYTCQTYSAYTLHNQVGCPAAHNRSIFISLVVNGQCTKTHLQFNPKKVIQQTNYLNISIRANMHNNDKIEWAAALRVAQFAIIIMLFHTLILDPHGLGTTAVQTERKRIACSHSRRGYCVLREHQCSRLCCEETNMNKYDDVYRCLVVAVAQVEHVYVPETLPRKTYIFIV